MNNQLFQQKLEDIINLVFEYQPSYAIAAGKENYARRVENGTKENYEEFISKFQEKIEEIKSIDPKKLAKRHKTERERIINSSEIFAFLHDEFPLWKRNPYGIDEIQNNIFMILQRKGPIEEALEIIIEQLKQLPKFLIEFRGRFKDEIIPKLWKEVTEERLEATKLFFDYLVMIFSIDRIQESMRKELQSIIIDLKKVIQEHHDWLQTLSIDEDEFAWAMGEEAFEKFLKLRKIPWDSKTILKKGYDLLESLTERLKIVAKKIDSNKTHTEVIEEILAYQPPTFEMVLEFAAYEAKRAKQFLKEKELLTLPEKESLKVIETPAFLAPILPFAACVPAPFYLSEEPGYYMITRPRKKEGLKKHSYYSISNTMVHEAYPGHHIDIESTSQIGSIYPLIAYGLCSHAAETIEGWAHYCEELMLEEGFHEEAEKVELVILLDQIWRAVRIIVDVELHTKRRSYEEAIEMLLKHTRMDQLQAIAEVNRYTTAPTYQLSYLIGKLLIQELREEQEKKLGKSFDLKKFNDTIIYSGELPYYLLKKEFE